ncbi:MAG: two-component system sensor histidine kinase NtrB, partial [Steroidobacteraceae bacterium]
MSERSLRQDETRFRALAEASPAAIFIAQNGRISYANPALAALTGFEPAELLGMDPLDLVHASDRAGVEARRDARVRDETWEAHHEVRIQTRTGDECWIDLTTTQVVYESGAAVVGTGIDVTERKRLEQRMQQGQRLEAIGRLAGGVAHDFNNLLNVIGGYSSLLVESLPEGDDRAMAREIEAASERAARLIHQLLAFGRRQILAPRVLDAGEVITELAPLIRRIVGENVEFRTILMSEPSRVRVDPTQLEQVLVNLIANARDAMPSGGQLTVEVADVELDDLYAATHPEVVPGPHVMIAISDTGAGMSQEVREHVFEPFFTTKEASGGTGLGLATVYGIVKQSGGSINVYSEPGHGSVFKVYLPRVFEPADERPARIAAAAELEGTETILLAEDDEAVRGVT